MLRFHTPTGSIEATAKQEARVRGLSNGELLHELRTSTDPDPFAIAEALHRKLLVHTPGYGWHLPAAAWH